MSCGAHHILRTASNALESKGFSARLSDDFDLGSCLVRFQHKGISLHPGMTLCKPTSTRALTITFRSTTSRRLVIPIYL